MTIAMRSINPGSHYLGGAQFWGSGDRLFSVRANIDKTDGSPIEVQAGRRGHRIAMDLSLDEAEALAEGIKTAIRLRKAADGGPPKAFDTTTARQAVTSEAARMRAFFADSDGPLESA